MPRIRARGLGRRRAGGAGAGAFGSLAGGCGAEASSRMQLFEIFAIDRLALEQRLGQRSSSWRLSVRMALARA